MKELLDQIRQRPPANLFLYEFLTGATRQAEVSRQKEMDRALAKMADRVTGPEKPKTQRRVRGIVVKKTGRVVYDGGINMPAEEHRNG